MPSFIWNFFDKEGKKGICKLCKATLSLGSGSSTAGPRSHLQTKHQINEENFGQHCSFLLYIFYLYHLHFHLQFLLF